VVGTVPLIENVATLIDPPGSELDELTWVSATAAAAGCDLLLDLHNLYANAINFGYDPLDFIAGLPPGRIAAVHLAGGKWVRALGEQRWLDDHLHDVPAPVYDLLTAVGACVPQPLTVILERDGEYPAIALLLAQLDRARTALAAGRARHAGLCTGEVA
jgi:uncharacterized protein